MPIPCNAVKLIDSPEHGFFAKDGVSCKNRALIVV